ncbi:MAG TPA: hypothetical protein VFQ92_09195 [Blastocatellia bacterium]|nr:hypothetical protein [Blastocatellia bacterium]
MAEAAPLYDVKAMGLCGVALRLYEKEFDEWMAQHEYIGSPVSREEMACNQVELHIISDRIQRAAGYPEDQKTLDELWRRAIIEQIDYCYGRKMTEEELLLDWEKWKQVREDMAAGKPASKSEAARYLREMDEQYPRKSGLRTYRPDEVSKF